MGQAAGALTTLLRHVGGFLQNQTLLSSDGSFQVPVPVRCPASMSKGLPAISTNSVVSGGVTVDQLFGPSARKSAAGSIVEC